MKKMRFEVNINHGGGGVYIIKNNKDTRVYIGRTKNFEQRAKEHKRNFEKLRCNRKIKAFIKAHPDAVFYFEVIKRTEDKEQEEEKQIKLFDSVRGGFNMIYNDSEIRACLLKYWKKRRKSTKSRAIKQIKEKPTPAKLTWLKSLRAYKSQLRINKEAI